MHVDESDATVATAGAEGEDRIVVRRQKRRGMQWGAQSSDALAALRTLQLNEGWDRYWQGRQLIPLAVAARPIPAPTRAYVTVYHLESETPSSQAPRTTLTRSFINTWPCDADALHLPDAHATLALSTCNVRKEVSLVANRAFLVSTSSDDPNVDYDEDQIVVTANSMLPYSGASSSPQRTSTGIPKPARISTPMDWEPSRTMSRKRWSTLFF